MSSGRFRAGAVAGRALLIFTLFFASVSLRGQMYPGYPFGIPRGASGGWNRPFGYPAGEPRGLDITVPEFPPRPPAATAGTVSSDILRHPLSSKARRMLEKALRLSGVGDHPAAIEALRDALVKQPAAAPYIESALGVEYIETRQFTAALASFAEAVEQMPHESATHSNFGLALAATGQLDRAESELRKALEIDRGNTKAQSILEVVAAMKRAPAAPGAQSQLNAASKPSVSD